MTGGQQHSAGFQELIERRRKFIEGLEANKGEINLDIFEDFYPDKAHFVYELLQNAEDAGASEVAFTLTPDRLVCEHDGRAFILDDVISITGLHDSTKANAQDKIGKFGVGFKSVFVYTQAPSIFSCDFAFRIVQLILPEPIAADQSLQGRTRFEFPFDNPKKPSEEACAEVAAGLNVELFGNPNPLMTVLIAFGPLQIPIMLALSAIIIYMLGYMIGNMRQIGNCSGPWPFRG